MTTVLIHNLNSALVALESASASGSVEFLEVERARAEALSIRDSLDAANRARRAAEHEAYACESRANLLLARVHRLLNT